MTRIKNAKKRLSVYGTKSRPGGNERSQVVGGSSCRQLSTDCKTSRPDDSALGFKLNTHSSVDVSLGQFPSRRVLETSHVLVLRIIIIIIAVDVAATTVAVIVIVVVVIITIILF